jgi:hypothetical protein
MGEPVGGALGRHPGHDENDSLPGKSFGLPARSLLALKLQRRQAASAKAGVNLLIEKHERSCPLPEFTLSEVFPFP